MNIENKLFHAVIPYGTKFDKEKMLLLKLESIFKTKKILCRSEIDKIFNYHNYCAMCFNGYNYISLCEFIKREYDDYVVSRGDDTLCRYPLKSVSIVLNRQLFKENRLILDNFRIPFEIQVEGNIDLKYMDAIALPKHLQTDKIFDLIEKYNIKVPIIEMDIDKLNNVKILKK